jgi:hypothetical protein
LPLYKQKTAFSMGFCMPFSCENLSVAGIIKKAPAMCAEALIFWELKQ